MSKEPRAFPLQLGQHFRYMGVGMMVVAHHTTPWPSLTAHYVTKSGRVREVSFPESYWDALQSQVDFYLTQAE